MPPSPHGLHGSSSAADDFSQEDMNSSLLDLADELGRDGGGSSGQGSRVGMSDSPYDVPARVLRASPAASPGQQPAPGDLIPRTLHGLGVRLAIWYKHIQSSTVRLLCCFPYVTPVENGIQKLCGVCTCVY